MSEPDPPDDHEARLAPLRAQVDDIDRRLVALLNERARVIVEIGKVKQDTGGPIYAPHREAEVLAKVLALSEGPLPPRAIEGVYRELMSGSFAIEQPLRIGYLGPAGSFSHVAAVAHFGSSVSYENLHEIEGVFTEVRRGHVDYGLVPIENSTGGGIAETLDAFTAAASEVTIYAEVAMTIRHNLLANVQPREVRRIHSKPEVFAQCRKWLATQYPSAELVPSASSSEAVRHVAEDTTGRAAAIGSRLAGQLYGVELLFESIEDRPNNVTRFFVIARSEARPSGDDKTSLMFATAHEPGALARVLSAFADAGVNLTHIDKRPSQRDNWSYTFFVDLVGHREDPAVAAAIDAATAHCQQMWTLGSYPRARRIL